MIQFLKLKICEIRNFIYLVQKPFEFYTADFVSVVMQELLRDSNRNFSTLIYSRGFSSLCPDRIFIHNGQFSREIREANFVPFVRKGLRVFPLSERPR